MVPSFGAAGCQSGAGFRDLEGCPQEGEGGEGIRVAAVFQGIGVAPAFAENRCLHVGIVMRFQSNKLTLAPLFQLSKPKTVVRNE